MIKCLDIEYLPCGCHGQCDPYAHDTAWDWDGTPDGPDYTRCFECDSKVYEGDMCECMVWQRIQRWKRDSYGRVEYTVTGTGIAWFLK